MKISIVAALMVGSVLSCCSVYAGSISSLTVGEALDSNVAPAVRAADSGQVVVRYSGKWFDSGVCELYVDGELVGTSTSSDSTYALAAGDGTWRSYSLTLKSGDSKTTRFVTVYPSAEFPHSLHSLTQRRNLLDARPAGTVRKIHPGDYMGIAWSALWNEAADQSVVTLYKGTGTGGESLGELVSRTGGGEEGDYDLAERGLPLGRYTLTHFDGVETLVAYLNLTGRGFMLIFK